MTGKFEEVEFTFGSFGQQYTTIDGVKYVTWFDLMDSSLRGLAPGTIVEYEVRPPPTVLCNAPYVTSGFASAKLVAITGKTGVGV